MDHAALQQNLVNAWSVNFVTVSSSNYNRRQVDKGVSVTSETSMMYHPSRELIVYGLGHETVAVLLPGLAINW